jgi:hypothetical protein
MEGARMAKLRSSQIYQTVGMLAVCVGAIVLGFALGNSRNIAVKAAAPLVVRQSDEKSIQISQRSDELLEFGNLSVKHVKLSPSGTFNASSLAAKSERQVEDWIENLEFTLRSKADKQITYIQFELQFPDTEVNGPLMVYREFGLGVHPQSGGELRGGALRYGKPLALSPGDTAIATLSDDHLQRIKHFIGLRNFQLNDMHRVVVKILSVTFDDGLMWSSGHFYRPNPGTPGGYERINR